MKKVLIFNIVGILIILALCEVLAYCFMVSGISGIDAPMRYYKPVSFEQLYAAASFRHPAGTEYKKRPVIIFGCSFAYGHGLEDNQTLGYKLSHITQRPVYNRAIPAYGIQHMLWQLQNEPELDTIKAPEYIIFVLINDHLRRLITDYSYMQERLWLVSPYLTYVEKNGRLEVKQHPFSFFYNSYLLDEIMYLKSKNKIKSAQKSLDEAEKLSELVKLHFRESKSIIDKKYPGTKLVILKYYNMLPLERTDIWNELAGEGFIVIDVKELTGKNLYEPEFRLPDDGHPNEHAWDVIVPALAKRLKL